MFDKKRDSLLHRCVLLGLYKKAPFDRPIFDFRGRGKGDCVVTLQDYFICPSEAIPEDAMKMINKRIDVLCRKYKKVKRSQK